MIETKIKLKQEDFEYLAFLQEQIVVRESGFTKWRNGTRYGKDEKIVSEYLVLNMCWNEYIKVHLKLYPSINHKEFRIIWIQVEKYVASLLPKLKHRVSEKVS